MCGRYTLYTEREVLARRFEVELPELAPSYNVAPTQSVVAVRMRQGGRLAMTMRWGLVPFWAKDGEQLPQMINARVESVATRAAYRDSFRRRRCLILADGFYEWEKRLGPGRRKIPHWVRRADGDPFAMAGIWSVWKPRESLLDERLYSCAIITTAANAAVSDLHDRMPVILPRAAESAWLDPALDNDVAALQQVLVAVGPEELRSHPVSTRVNSADNDDSSLIEFSDADPQLGFF